MPVPHKTAFWRRVWQMTVGRGLQPLAHRVHTAHFTAIRFLGSVNAGATAGNITSHLERGTDARLRALLISRQQASQMARFRCADQASSPESQVSPQTVADGTSDGLADVGGSEPGATRIMGSTVIRQSMKSSAMSSEK